MNSLIRNNKYIIHIVLLAIYILWILNLDYFYPFIRFKSLKLNDIFSLCIQIIPLMLLINGFRFKHISAKIINSIFSLTLSLISIAVAIVILFNISTLNKNEAFMPVHKIMIDSSSVVVYRTNFGATTDYGIVVRQEKEIIKGILVVKNLLRQDHIYDISIKKLGDNAVELMGKKIYLKRNVYFP
ncbi:hypothetical protein [Thermoanaerobacterium sp. RBIITD]|uniref:hypothetical protein n=1 Tax=Thermoanaerobacterium sp. RBIITD TaxID=1550240 RepID=UPI000BB82C13|nr:hypothetical protein [Thermoanaerobacterium sp. RBIITD]SNX53298.1 hypothetical protein SAMN05660242_0818 [Thermoanaerobacterium sp. RBIITD]